MTTFDWRGEFVKLVHYDWLYTGRSSRLHAINPNETITDSDVDEWGFCRPVRFACGRSVDGAWIPGVFSRMGMDRCAQCCRALDLPPGKGSPKNDDGCRPLVGLT